MDLGKAWWATRGLRPGRTPLLAQEQVMTEEPERPTGRSLAKGWGGGQLKGRQAVTPARGHQGLAQEAIRQVREQRTGIQILEKCVRRGFGLRQAGNVLAGKKESKGHWVS